MPFTYKMHFMKFYDDSLEIESEYCAYVMITISCYTLPVDRSTTFFHGPVMIHIYDVNILLSICHEVVRGHYIYAGTSHKAHVIFMIPVSRDG